MRNAILIILIGLIGSVASAQSESEKLSCRFVGCELSASDVCTSVRFDKLGESPMEEECDGLGCQSVAQVLLTGKLGNRNFDLQGSYGVLGQTSVEVRDLSTNVVYSSTAGRGVNLKVKHSKEFTIDVLCEFKK